MNEEKDYIRDIAEIRSLMERSTKFLSLAGWAGLMAGLYALAGVYIAYTFLAFNPDQINYSSTSTRILAPNTLKVIALAFAILVLSIGTAIVLSHRKATKRNETLWNATTKRLLYHMAVPLIAGGLLCLILINKGLIGLLAPASLLFYGLALYNASLFTYKEVKSLGLIQIGLGLFSAYFVGYGLACWALGFGVFHIIYGIYMHYRYER